MAEKPDTQTPDTEERQYAPDEVNQYGDYIKIGGSPVPGLTLRHVLRGHTDYINRIAWSPDGKYLASPSNDKTIRIWDVSKGKCIRILEGHANGVVSVAWSPDGQRLASASDDSTVRLWATISGKHLQMLLGHTDVANCVAWSPNSQHIASASDDGIICVWNAANGKKMKQLKGHVGLVFSVIWSMNSAIIVSSGGDGTIRVWDVSTGICLHSLEGHTKMVVDVSLSPDNHTLASASWDKTIRIWETFSGKALKILEGHSDYVRSAVFSANGLLLASKSKDNTIHLWRCDLWACVAVLGESASETVFTGLAFHPVLPILATLGEKNRIIRIWELDEAVLLGQAKENVNYTTAKLVLVGDSGVGKTGLGWRLAYGEFKEHASTHGQQFWSIPQLNLRRKDGTDCEAVLWDLAGQHVYRQVHSIFLENVAAALVLFDPTNRQEPLKGAQFWLEQLKGKGQLPPTVLVGARVDRGAPALSQAELDQFCQRYGIQGGYISTSALKGDGLDELMEILKKQIPWDEMTATVTTVTFKRIKDYVLGLKEKTDRKGVLVSPGELRKLLEADEGQKTKDEGKPPASVVGPSSSVWEFTDPEMMTAVGHLETNGIVTILKSSSGESHILLAPELLVNIAASIMLLADKNARELGAVSETDLLGGKVAFDELKGLEKAEQQILIEAAIRRFLEHSICFRETLNGETLLIFPSLIKQKRPLRDEIPAADDISYVVRGRVENLYASLVVLLGYTPSFTRINQWQNQAQYEMREGEICGFRLIEEREGEIELVLYYADSMPPGGRDKFQELFEQFLYQREVEVTRFPPVVCKHGHQQKRATVIERVREKKPFMFCDECGDKVPLPDFDAPQTIGLGASPWLQREEAMARLRSSYEKHLTNIKSYRHGWAMPRAYLSYLPDHKGWAEKLIHDLRDAGVYVVEKRADLQAEDFVIVLDTPAYRKAYQASSPALASDAGVIRSRMQSGNNKVLSLGCEGRMAKHEFKTCTPGDFCDETHYSISLFNLVMEHYAIPLNHKGFEPLRHSLHEQWENTLAGKEAEEISSTFKIFISYSHKDEAFKDELVIMLTGLQRRNIVEAWQDRLIEAGDEWNQSIQTAMDECDLALLLVSPDYLASRFIQEQEQPKLLQRREEMKTRIIPIIVRPCLWQSEPALKGIQALPRDNKAVITFAKETGARDQAWADIAAVIEKRAKEKSG